jgi:hypothetical protein
VSTLSIVDSLHRHITDDGVNVSVLKSGIFARAVQFDSGLLSTTTTPPVGRGFFDQPA